MRLAQIGIGAPAVGHIPGNAVHQALVRHDPGVPLEPAHGAVGADHPVLGRDDPVPLVAEETGEQVAGLLHVIGVVEGQVGP
jgi:hypothetical protein